MLEYITGWLMEAIFHTRWWDYSKKPFNLQGYICLGSSIAWGAFTVLLFYVFQPFVEWITGLYPVSVGKVGISIVSVLYAVDFGSSAVTAFNLSKAFGKVEDMLEDLSSYLHTTKLYETKEEVREKLDELRVINASELAERIAEKKAEFSLQLEKKQLQLPETYEEMRAELEKRMDEFKEKYITIRKKTNPVRKRMIQAYPGLKTEFRHHLERKSGKRQKTNFKVKEELYMAFLTFRGGVHPYDGKELSKEKPITDYAPGKELVYPLSQHIGAPAKPVVKKGDHVLAGQMIAEAGGFVSAPIHASVSGTVTGIKKILNNMGSKVDAIIIENDEQYESVPDQVTESLDSLSKEEILNKIREGGVVGMGGAGFPTHVKLSPKEPDKIEYVLVNGAECEPYLTSDYRRMMDYPDELIGGLKCMLKLFDNAKGCICIEDNKPDCIAKMTELVKDEPRIEVKTLKTKYPQGAERCLIYA